MPRNALGRGLGALIREHEAQPTPAPTPPAGGPATGVVPAREIPLTNASATRELDIDLIEPSPYQPRSHFREEALEELAREGSIDADTAGLVATAEATFAEAARELEAIRDGRAG